MARVLLLPVSLCIALVAATTTEKHTDVWEPSFLGFDENGRNTSKAIIGGSVVPAGSKTYAVGLRETATGTDVCGGSLISATHVLTAAHCYGLARYAAVGTHYASGDSDGVRVAIKRETRHPRYNARTLDYDFNIIELAAPVTRYTPVKLYSADPETFAGSTATVLGWGATSSGGSESKELRRVDVPVLSATKCKAAGLSHSITSTMFCAGGARDRDACQGDSGGPIILEQSSGDVLIGAVSWGNDCGVAGKPGVYAKVSAVKTWIQGIAMNVTLV